MAAAGEIGCRADAATPIYWIELRPIDLLKIYAVKEADEEVERTLLEKLNVERQLELLENEWAGRPAVALPPATVY